MNVSIYFLSLFIRLLAFVNASNVSYKLSLDYNSRHLWPDINAYLKGATSDSRLLHKLR